jgi:hypothetical protein
VLKLRPSGRTGSFLPKTEVLLPALTTVSPVMVPETVTTFLVGSTTAEVRAAKEITVTVVPPEPSVVLTRNVRARGTAILNSSNLPSVQSRVSDPGNIGRGGSFFELRCDLKHV